MFSKSATRIPTWKLFRLIVPGSMMQLMLQGQINQSGNYLLMADKDTLMGLSCNCDRKESDLNCMTAEKIEKQAGNAGLLGYKVLEGSAKGLDAQLMEFSQGTKLWKYFIILTLLFLGIEILLLKFWKS